MTDPHHDELAAVDDAARKAARGLRAHVDARVHPDVVLATLPAAPHRASGRNRFLAVAAVAAMVLGSAVVLSDHQEDARSRLELDEDGNPLPVPTPGVLTALGPRDGRDSIGLPVAVEPNRDLRDGDIVVASSGGFEPGEQVGIVQCAKEAGGDSPETRGGIDGCQVGSVVYATASAEGVATGRFPVRRVLTTPLTGTVDCAAEAERCLVAMGAINNYDRSGGFGIAFAGGGEPIAIPAVTVEPADGLRDGDTVRIRGEGFAPGEVVGVSICSTDPSACRQTGGSSEGSWGVPTDEQGRIDAEVVVYRFLPGVQPATYVDCAISPCSLRVEGETAPPPVRLGFVADAEKPVPPAVAVDPSTDLGPGDTVVVRGAGFEPDDSVFIYLCVGPPGEIGAEPQECASSNGEPVPVDDDGTFAVEFELPDLGPSEGTATTTCVGVCDGAGSAPPLVTDRSCDGVRSSCSIQVQSNLSGEGIGPPAFAPAPVLVTWRPSG